MAIYEGLLEHEFRIADAEGVAAVSEDGGQVWKPASEVTAAEAVEIVEEGGLYVVNDEGERKATGAYYTPDYVVTYIVEETVDPLIDEIDTDLRDRGLEPSDREYFAEFYQRVQDLTVLDPAMGSGHFLTKATGYLTEQVMEVVREQEIQSYDEQEIRREISKEVIYGVDLNGMAVELSKLSMWLETLAADQPLAFLDHHLKDGNSLVGSDITEVLSDDTEESGGQLTLTQAFARVRQDTLEHVMELMADLLAYDNDSLESVKSMEELYDEIRDDPLYTRLFELANVHTAEEFGADVPEDAYEQMAGAIENEDDWTAIRGEDWFTAAQATDDEQNFFHWELEFPEVFFDAEGEKMSEAGFDAVVGNPPYVRQEQLSNSKTYLERSFETYHGVADLYVYFIEKGRDLLHTNGRYGQIVSNKFMRSNYGGNLRDYLVEKTNLKSIIDFGDLPVFPDVSAYPSIIVFEKHKSSNGLVDVARLSDLEFTDLRQDLVDEIYGLEQSTFLGEQWTLATKNRLKALNKLENSKNTLSKYIDSEINYGVKTGYNEAFFISEEKRQELISKDERSSEIIKPLATGKNVRPYYIEDTNQYLIFTRRGINIENYPAIKEHLQQYKADLEPKPADYTGSWNGRKPGDYEWYEIQDTVDYWESFEENKICYPVIGNQPRFCLDTNKYYLNDKCFIIPENDWYLVSLLNSSAAHLWFDSELSTLRGGYYEFRAVHLENFPVPNPPESKNKKLSDLCKKITKYTNQKRVLNLDLTDHISGEYDSNNLANIALIQPVTRQDRSYLEKTKETYPNLRVGTARVNRESPNTVLIEATARYKPDDEDAYETDRWGYTETEYLPAFRITDLTETEADLIEHFVPVAVDEAGGFANFYEAATKTNSLVDRLKAIELPDVDDVADDLENYLRTKERAEELDAKIEQTDTLIDEIVYELYGLTEEEIAIVEEALAD
ncbi:putative restriction/modification enzyme [Halorubrum aidingense JCM 13560]|uniref:site-specific DNA-methyltransferase (adenine-specific) n=1 Tax=Halorubrum aidingense JCM 13560 TaxID=1230454 RepID=M0PJ97_9EURY|nr:N-6 DNA methylase [Halorubrum aidingense]EMA68830.1 putative restriction/modification enzyme [Halorubrum aidingense JCM 13560]